MSDTARIAPLPIKQWPEAMREAVAVLRPANARYAPLAQAGGSKGLNVLGTMAHHPELARAFHVFNGYLLYNTRLTERQRELIVLRVAILRNSNYEWRQHVDLARHFGITDEEIKRIEAGPSVGGWVPLEQAMMQGVDELIGDANVSDETWAALSEHFGTEELMDFVFTVGAYELLAMAFNTFGLQPDEDVSAPSGK